jgi:uncharacterized protein
MKLGKINQKYLKEQLMEIKYVEDHTVFECTVGSQAYGTNSPDSDEDRAGIMIPGKDYFYGMKNFDQFQGYETDKTIYNFKKAIRLISENNPNMLDLLCIPSRCIIKVTPYWQEIMDNADLFISKKCKFTFSGYAISQINRIRTHRAYILNPPKKRPERLDYNLPNISMFETAQLKALINVESLFEYVTEENRETFVNQLDTIYGNEIVPLFHKYLNPDRKTIALEFLQTALQSQLGTFISLGKRSYVKDQFVEQAEKELVYANEMRNWQRYEDWKKHRNKKRAVLEEKVKYDPKFAAHALRLVRMGEEILKTGKVNVDRTNIDAEELKEIKNGAWPFEQVESYVCSAEQNLNSLYEKSTLQKAPKIEKIDELSIKIIDEYLREN